MRVEDMVVENVYMTTEAIDPLYTGEYAIAPYERPPVTPSGSPMTMADWSGVAGTGGNSSWRLRGMRPRAARRAPMGRRVRRRTAMEGMVERIAVPVRDTARGGTCR